MGPPPPDTIVALATPSGTAAIAVIRASGPRCSEMAVELTGKPPQARVAVHADYRDARGRILDDVLLTYFQGPSSYTGEDSLEISCHGNPLIAQSILEDLLARQFRLAEPGEFTRRAFLNGRLDLTQAEAVMDLIHARSERAIAAAQQQLRGGLSRHLSALVEPLLHVLAQVEAYIDFPDEDLPQEDRSQLLRQLDEVLRGTRRLLATSHYGELLRQGVRTVILGEPNAGKSSLLNRLVGRDRALVSAEPGTTRDYIEESVIVGPHNLRLIDTAGLNPAPEAVERLGMEKSMEQAERAHLILLVVDSTRPPPSLPPALLAHLSPATTLIVANKADLLGQRPLKVVPEGLAGDWPVVQTSALTGEGINDLAQRIGDKVDKLTPRLDDDHVAVNVRHADALRRAIGGLELAGGQISSGGPVELVASELRGALDAFGEIGGRIDNERMLDHLFASFCIGK